ncbi:5-formyltetrahydrofolate cyclo-ligase [Deinococcus fonticola]|uniref:5-formyltetrahydrofolate cyclo-ligase n=1 Tax=Deinococcus fonticola TaxID=2528713 RepID=UPI001F10F591|nr:5-formyltetrahydrofolate cyclo-ligase [Deinococcus fonticola]
MSSVPDVTTSKADWRAWAFATRQSLPADLDPADVVAHLRAFLQGRGARRVLAYRALPGEPDMSALAQEFELFTTRTRYKPERHLTLHPWDTASEVSKFGYLQPPASAPQVALSSLDAVLLPGLAYDRHGVRMGYGGGFYDRLLPGFVGPSVGVVWSALTVPHLPREPHDCPVGWVATEQGLWQTEA